VDVISASQSPPPSAVPVPGFAAAALPTTGLFDGRTGPVFGALGRVAIQRPFGDARPAGERGCPGAGGGLVRQVGMGSSGRGWTARGGNPRTA
jgi:hypothetical protein